MVTRENTADEREKERLSDLIVGLIIFISSGEDIKISPLTTRHYLQTEPGQGPGRVQSKGTSVLCGDFLLNESDCHLLLPARQQGELHSLILSAVITINSLRRR